MPIDKDDAVKHLDSVLQLYACVSDYDPEEYESLPSDADRHEALVGLFAALRRLAPPGSEYDKAVERAARLDEGYEHKQLSILTGAARSLRSDYANERLQTFRELLNADLFSDFLAMAEYLLHDENLKQPAAVVAGGVLEEHIRRLCDKNGIATTYTDAKGKVKPKSVETMSADLRKKRIYGTNEQKQVTAWYGIRNSAAHAKYDEFGEDQVRSMIEGLRGFISKYPA